MSQDKYEKRRREQYIDKRKSSSRKRPQPRDTDRQKRPVRRQDEELQRSTSKRAMMERRRRAQLKKRRRRKRIAFTAFLLCFAVLGYTVYNLFNSALIRNDGALPREIGTPKEIEKDVITFLICGIDYEEGRSYGTNMGMTDVILYVSFDIKANHINILQIPRDTYVGSDVSTGGSGKINSVAFHSGETPAVASLAKLINEKMKLPVDYYITIDMDAFKEIIDVLGGIEVYVPERMELDGNVLEEGLQHMDGATAEFFVRYRNFAQADIKRLEMQRYFYAAVFKKLISFPPSDVVKVLPAYMQYVQTDLNLSALGSLFPKVMNVPAENITIYKVPGEAVMHNGHSVYSVHTQPLVNLLNEGFRPYQTQLTTADVTIPELAYTNDYVTGEGVSLSGFQT